MSDFSLVALIVILLLWAIFVLALLLLGAGRVHEDTADRDDAVPFYPVQPVPDQPSIHEYDVVDVRSVEEMEGGDGVDNG